MLIKEIIYPDLVKAKIVVEGNLLDCFYEPAMPIQGARRLNMEAIAKNLVEVDFYIQDCCNGKARSYLSKTLELGLTRTIEYPVIEIVARRGTGRTNWEELVTQATARILTTLSSSASTRMAVVYLEDKCFCVADDPSPEREAIVLGF